MTALLMVLLTAVWCTGTVLVLGYIALVVSWEWLGLPNLRPVATPEQPISARRKETWGNLAGTYCKTALPRLL